MIDRLSVRGYKSLRDTEIGLRRVTLLLGPTGAGKSNILRAVLALSSMAEPTTLAEALSASNDSDPEDCFSLPPQGGDERPLSIEADVRVLSGKRLRYRVGVGIEDESGLVRLREELLAKLSKQGKPTGFPTIETVEKRIKIRRRVQASPPYIEETGLNHTLLSDLRLAGERYPEVEECRKELSGWHIYRLGAQASRPPVHRRRAVTDIGGTGELLLPFLQRLRSEEEAVYNLLKERFIEVVDGVEDMAISFDETYGAPELTVTMHGAKFKAQGLPEGVLRVIALLSLMVNPWGEKVVAVDEPENGLDPKAANLLGGAILQLAMEEEKQLIISTHSPWLCEAIYAQSQMLPEEIALYHVQNGGGGTQLSTFEGLGPLFGVSELVEALES